MPPPLEPMDQPADWELVHDASVDDLAQETHAAAALDDDELDLEDGDGDGDDDGDYEDDEDDDEDDESPIGDGVADLESTVECPYCGEPVEITLDPGSGSHQQYIEDCSVCCRPWNVSVTYDEDGRAFVFVDASDDR